MQLLVVAATEKEIAPFLAQNPTQEYLITGIGVPACLYSLLKKIQYKKYDVIIQAGIAGCFSEEIGLGETVLVKKDVFADQGVFEKEQYFSLPDAGLSGKDDWPYNNGWLVNENKALELFDLKKVNALTIHTISDESKMTNHYLLKYPSAIESMEGAAFHYVCLQEKIPFIQMRSISNRVGERDKTKWKIKEAIDNLNAALEHLVRDLSVSQKLYIQARTHRHK